MINVYVFLFGGLLLSIAANMYFIIAARLVIGFASGLASVLVPVYLGEIAAPTLRGALGTHSVTHLRTHSLTHPPTHSYSLTHLLTHLLTTSS
jgi:hypothetical protein